MTEKRFREVVSIKTIKDNVTGIAYAPCLVNDDFLDLINTIAEENGELKQKNENYKELIKAEPIAKSDGEITKVKTDKFIEILQENEELKSENKRLTDKLNKIAVELVDECISQGKATEICEMSYREFLDYRAKNGKPMELQL